MYGLNERSRMLLARAIVQADLRLEVGTVLPRLRFVGMHGDRIVLTLAGDEPPRELPAGGDNENHANDR